MDSCEEPKPDWPQHKEAYLAHLAQASRVVRLVSASADKLYNARSILSDLRVQGPSVGAIQPWQGRARCGTTAHGFGKAMMSHGCGAMTR